MAPIDFEFQIQVVQPHPAFIVEPLAGRFINVMTTTRAKPIKPSLLPSATKLRRLCFYTCLSVHRGEYLGSTPRDQVHPPGPGTPPGTRYTPRDQVHPPEPGTPPGTRYPPPPWTRYTPQDQIQPPGTRYTPPRPSTPLPPGDGYCCGRYASYWNAFLYSYALTFMWRQVFI